MSGQHRRNLHGIEQLPDRFARHLVAAQFFEGVAQRHGRARVLAIVGPQAAHALALLAKVDQVKEEAEGVRDVRCGSDAEPVHFALARFQQLGVDVQTDLLGEIAEVFYGAKRLRPALLLHDHAQARRQQPHFTSKGFIHLLGIIRARTRGDSPDRPSPTPSRPGKLPAICAVWQDRVPGAGAGGFPRFRRGVA